VDDLAEARVIGTDLLCERRTVGVGRAQSDDGGYFDPPIDFAKEAEAAGAYGELVTDPGEVEHALRRGLRAIREDGKPAVISVWLARLLQKD
jgi:acetolactate synthase-1/2/3 large subunit